LDFWFEIKPSGNPATDGWSNTVKNQSNKTGFSGRCEDHLQVAIKATEKWLCDFFRASEEFILATI
jgi:hypothetical protein